MRAKLLNITKNYIMMLHVGYIQRLPSILQTKCPGSRTDQVSPSPWQLLREDSTACIPEHHHARLAGLTKIHRDDDPIGPILWLAQ